MAKVVCNFCDPARVISEVEPMDSDFEIPGICPECYQKLAAENEIPQIEIPARLGKCDILKVHDDGDLTVRCGGRKIIVSTEGEVYPQEDITLLQDDPMALTPLEDM